MYAPMTLPGRITIYTYKEGLLSRLAHDLRLTVNTYAVTLAEGHITATMDPTSIRVDGAVHQGALDERTLSDSDRKKIENTLVQDVLRCRQYPEIRYEGAVIHDGNGRFTARGKLSLAGREVELEIPITLRDRVRGDLEIVPSRWGIAPFRAMAGALKVQDRVRVVFDLPAEPQTVNPTDWQHVNNQWSSSAPAA